MKLFFDLMLKVMTGSIPEKLVQTAYLCEKAETQNSTMAK